eukprot:SAG31_NODE_3327_length_4408_cov_2.998669_4_plen_263_part_00
MGTFFPLNGGAFRSPPAVPRARARPASCQVRCWRAVALVAVVALSNGLAPSAAASAGGAGCLSVTHLVRTAERMCSSAVGVEEALESVGVRRADGIFAAERLAALGFRTVLDLKLLALAGGQEIDRLMVELGASGVTAGDRAKVRLLVVGNPGEQNRGLSQGSQMWAAMNHNAGAPSCALEQQHGDDDAMKEAASRRLQIGESLSLDTLAIVMSVLVGAAGYVLQVRSPSSRQTWPGVAFAQSCSDVPLLSGVHFEAVGEDC